MCVFINCNKCGGDMEIHKSAKLLLASGLSLGLIGSLTADAATDVSYTGDTTDTQHAQSLGANASSPGAYADVTMDYTMPDVVALGVYTNGEITSTEGAPLLAGKFSQNSDLSITNESVILNDIVTSSNVVDAGNDSEVLRIYGVVYSSSGAGTVTVEPLSEGTSAAALPTNSVNAQFDNQTNSGSFDVAFSGWFQGIGIVEQLLGNSSFLTNSGNTTMDASNQGTFAIEGDIQEDTVTNADDTGVYEGGVRVTITSL